MQPIHLYEMRESFRDACELARRISKYYCVSPVIKRTNVNGEEWGIFLSDDDVALMEETKMYEEEAELDAMLDEEARWEEYERRSDNYWAKYPKYDPLPRDFEGERKLARRLNGLDLDEPETDED